MQEYQVIIGSPIDYEYLTADIVIAGKYIARVNMEEGNDNMIIEFFEKGIDAKIYVDAFQLALEDAKRLLLK